MKLSSLTGLFGVARWLAEAHRTDPTQEAKQQRQNKSAKIQTAVEETFANQLDRIAADEMADLRAYKRHKMFGGEIKPPEYGASDDEMRVIADDIRVTNIKPGSGVLPTLAGVAAGAAALYFGLPYIQPAKPEPPPVTQAPPVELGKPIQPPAPEPPVVIEHTTEFDYRVDSKVIPPQ